MNYIFKKGSEENTRTILLLHGTGGNERDLLPLADMVDADANVLSVRGDVLENGMPRFFRRLAEGIFDVEDLITRTEELNTFVNEKAKEYSFDRDNVIAIGYSNGANIAASLLYHYENSLRGAILHHPMVPRRGIDLPSMKETDVFIAAGVNDPLCTAEESEELERDLKQAGANVTVHWEHNGHQLTQTEVQASAEWYKTI